jgi:hypothetical protein
MRKIGGAGSTRKKHQARTREAAAKERETQRGEKRKQKGEKSVAVEGR